MGCAAVLVGTVVDNFFIVRMLRVSGICWDGQRGLRCSGCFVSVHDGSGLATCRLQALRGVAFSSEDSENSVEQVAVCFLGARSS